MSKSFAFLIGVYVGVLTALSGLAAWKCNEARQGVAPVTVEQVEVKQ